MHTASVMAVTMAPLVEPVTSEMIAEGMPLMMLQKMMSDMPLPTPR